MGDETSFNEVCKHVIFRVFVTFCCFHVDYLPQADDHDVLWAYVNCLLSGQNSGIRLVTVLRSQYWQAIISKEIYRQTTENSERCGDYFFSMR